MDVMIAFENMYWNVTHGSKAVPDPREMHTVAEIHRQCGILLVNGPVRMPEGEVKERNHSNYLQPVERQQRLQATSIIDVKHIRMLLRESFKVQKDVVSYFHGCDN
jgi:hypothetical protein